MSEVKIPEGYKQTEVGVIPEDWGVSLLMDITIDMLQGINTAIDKPEYVYAGVPILKANNVIDQVISLNDADQISYKSYLKYNQRYSVKRNDFLFSNIGARLGTGALWESDIAATFAWNVMRIIPDPRKVSPKFLAQLINSPKQSEEIQAQQSGSGMGFVPKATMQKLLLPLPKLKEQTAIATALSDVDNLIGSLEKLIAKKEAIKTGTMQQLLTGKTRLPEFNTREDGSKKGFKQTELGRIPEDWDVVNFDELLEPTISKKPINPSTLVTFVGMQDVTGNAQLANQTIVSYEKLKSGFTYFENGDVLLAKITPCFENGKGCHTETLKTKYGFGSTEFHVLRATEYSDSKFIYFWTTRNSFRIDLESTMVGSAGHRRVPLSAVKSYQIPCPTSKSEQTAIATILSDMDAEIQSFHQRLEKIKDIKQGMMQQLLTGKVRLAH